MTNRTNTKQSSGKTFSNYKFIRDFAVERKTKQESEMNETKKETNKKATN